jgi:hypothetical protein
MSLMMMTDLITPPPELVEQWFDASVLEGAITYDEFNFANLAARWGADQELDACAEWVNTWCTSRYLGDAISADVLRAARRPKPPSLKEQAQAELDRLVALIPTEGALAMAEPIRRALEALDD